MKHSMLAVAAGLLFLAIGGFPLAKTPSETRIYDLILPLNYSCSGW